MALKQKFECIHEADLHQSIFTRKKFLESIDHFSLGGFESNFEGVLSDSTLRVRLFNLPHTLMNFRYNLASFLEIQHFI